MRKLKLLISSPLAGQSRKLLSEDRFEINHNEGEPLSPAELKDACKDKDAIISVLTDRLDESFFESCPNLKLVANIAVGYDNIDIDAANKRGIIVCNTPGVLTQTTADLTFALMLSLSRRLRESEAYLRDGKWQRFSLNLLLGTDLHGKTLGIIGLGRIGQAVARRALGFSMQVLYFNRKRLSKELENSFNAAYRTLPDLLAQSDFVSIHCPLNQESRHLISEAELSMMKNSAYLINTARGAIVNEQALTAALACKQIAGAGLDVFENEPQLAPGLQELKNTVLVPHIGSATIETRSKMCALAVNAVIEAFNNKKPSNLLNETTWTTFQSRLSLS